MNTKIANMLYGMTKSMEIPAVDTWNKATPEKRGEFLKNLFLEFSEAKEGMEHFLSPEGLEKLSKNEFYDLPMDSGCI